MKISNKKYWKETVEKNQHPYSKAIVDYAKNWAELMESEIKEGKKLEKIAEETSREADTDGITGFMYGAAVSILSGCWEYGEQLRKWHNLKYQIENEGEKANKSGTVINPALISIGVIK